MINLRRCTLLLCLSVTSTCWADGNSVGKVYDPYVQPLEKEFELHSQYWADGREQFDEVFTYKAGYGQTLGTRLFAEFYLTAEGQDSMDSELSGYEIELKYQLTEQGEYNYDWGLLVEIEREVDEHVWESKAAVLLAKDWQRIGLLGNLAVVYESGKGIKNEWETEFSGQIKYRHAYYFEPGLELFLAENTQAFGPNFMGMLRMNDNRKLYWQLGLIAGIDAETPDLNLKLNLEYEF